MTEKLKLSDEEWKAKLSEEQYHILREGGTEPAFTGKYYQQKKKGVYKCAGCGLILFTSDSKFESGSGWPSFKETATDEGLEEVDDYSYFTHRVEVRCPRCGGHLGHVFDDGPEPTGLRYCINSAALEFSKE
jgi:peptide-methionine (R)-S-oxide reductase